VLACIVLFFVVCLVAVMAGDSDALSAADSVGLGEGIVVYFKRILVPYYRFLSLAAPLSFGCGFRSSARTTLLWALLTLIVLPGEVCSLTRLTALQNAIDRYYKSHGKYPSPVQDKWLGRECSPMRTRIGPHARLPRPNPRVETPSCWMALDNGFTTPSPVAGVSPPMGSGLWATTVGRATTISA